MRVGVGPVGVSRVSGAVLWARWGWRSIQPTTGPAVSGGLGYRESAGAGQCRGDHTTVHAKRDGAVQWATKAGKRTRTRVRSRRAASRNRKIKRSWLSNRKALRRGDQESSCVTVTGQASIL